MFNWRLSIASGCGNPTGEWTNSAPPRPPTRALTMKANSLNLNGFYQVAATTVSSSRIAVMTVPVLELVIARSPSSSKDIVVSAR